MGFSLNLPSSSDRPLTVQNGGKIFWASQLEAGLCFPIPPFFIRLANLYNMPLSQLNPVSIRKAIFFHMIMTLEGVADTTLLFFKSHQLTTRDVHFYFSPIGSFSEFYGRFSPYIRIGT